MTLQPYHTTRIVVDGVLGEGPATSLDAAHLFVHLGQFDTLVGGRRCRGSPDCNPDKHGHVLSLLHIEVTAAALATKLIIVSCGSSAPKKSSKPEQASTADWEMKWLANTASPPLVLNKPAW